MPIAITALVTYGLLVISERMQVRSRCWHANNPVILIIPYKYVKYILFNNNHSFAKIEIPPFPSQVPKVQDAEDVRRENVYHAEVPFGYFLSDKPHPWPPQLSA